MKLLLTAYLHTSTAEAAAEAEAAFELQLELKLELELEALLGHNWSLNAAPAPVPVKPPFWHHHLQGECEKCVLTKMNNSPLQAAATPTPHLYIYIEVMKRVEQTNLNCSCFSLLFFWELLWKMSLGFGFGFWLCFWPCLRFDLPFTGRLLTQPQVNSNPKAAAVLCSLFNLSV